MCGLPEFLEVGFVQEVVVVGFVFGVARFILVLDAHAVGVNEEHGEQGPLEGVAEVLERAGARLEPGPLPVGQAETGDYGDDEQDDVPGFDLEFLALGRGVFRLVEAFRRVAGRGGGMRLVGVPELAVAAASPSVAVILEFGHVPHHIQGRSKGGFSAGFHSRPATGV